MNERQTTGEFINYRIGERSGKTYNMIQEMAKEIDKLQKENEELKRKTYKAHINDKGEVQFVFDNYISKDKIRAKIKELEKEMNREDIQEEHFWCVEAERSVLVELLEDN